jgi:hypothetical protein
MSVQGQGLGSIEKLGVSKDQLAGIESWNEKGMTITGKA